VHSFPPDFRFDESKKHNNNGGTGRKKPTSTIGKKPASAEAVAEANGNGQHRSEDMSSGSMEVDGAAEVVFRRDSGSRRPLSLARWEPYNNRLCNLHIPVPVLAILGIGTLQSKLGACLVS
jgi:hypothetical protein